MKYLILIMLYLAGPTYAQDKSIVLASTTSTQNSGLYDYLLPMFTKDTGIAVKVVAVGTGQAIRIAQNGDADALLVHHRASEDKFMADGYGSKRFDVMYNDFVLIGPKDSEITAQSLKDYLTTFKATDDFTFVSRGDDSGTHKKEVELWTGLADGLPEAAWYRAIGAGMGAALNMASSVDAYTLSDRGTWLSFGNKGNLDILWAGDEALLNPYGLILVNPERFPHVRAELATSFAEWIISDKGQKAISDFRLDGKQLFCPNAEKLSLEQIIACPAR